MAWVLEIACNGRACAGRSRLCRGSTRGRPEHGRGSRDCRRSTSIVRLPDGAHDPFNDDKDRPLLIAMLEFSKRDATDAAPRAAIEQELVAVCRPESAATVTGDGAKVLSGGGRSPRRRRCARHFPMWCAIIARPRTRPRSLPTTSRRIPETLGKLPRNPLRSCAIFRSARRPAATAAPTT